MTSPEWLVPPPTARARLGLLRRTVVELMRIEVAARNASTAELCRRRGITFAGFDRPADLPQPRRLNLHVAHRWWAVETVLRWWPLARGRLCLRRSLLLGHHLRHLSPTLCIEVLSVTPFRAHAWLLVNDHRLDMGDAGPIVTAVRPEVP